jgi:outer membrane protein assembly factor BamB
MLQELDEELESGEQLHESRRIWQRPLMKSYDMSQSTPGVDGDAVYALSFEGVLYCIDSRNGRQRWRKDLVADYWAVRPYYGFAGSPVIADDLIILNANSTGMAIDRRTGDLVWTSDPPPRQFPGAGPTTVGTN